MRRPTRHGSDDTPACSRNQLPGYAAATWARCSTSAIIRNITAPPVGIHSNIARNRLRGRSDGGGGLEYGLQLLHTVIQINPTDRRPESMRVCVRTRTRKPASRRGRPDGTARDPASSCRDIHFRVDHHGLHEIDIAFVGVRLDEIVALAADVAEVYVENLLARPELADHVEDLFAGILQHLRYGPLAEVEPVIRALLMDTNFFNPSTVPSTASIPWNPSPGGTPGSCGWQAMRTLYSFATGMTRSRK